jgi:hypothetical protein
MPLDAAIEKILIVADAQEVDQLRDLDYNFLAMPTLLNAMAGKNPIHGQGLSAGF